MDHPAAFKTQNWYSYVDVGAPGVTVHVIDVPATTGNVASAVSAAIGVDGPGSTIEPVLTSESYTLSVDTGPSGFKDRDIEWLLLFFLWKKRAFLRV